MGDGSTSEYIEFLYSHVVFKIHKHNTLGLCVVGSSFGETPQDNKYLRDILRK